MPYYTIRNNDNGETSEEWFSSFQQLTEFLENHPNCSQVLVAPKIVSAHGSTLSKTSQGWKDLLGKVKKNSGRGNTIKT